MSDLLTIIESSVQSLPEREVTPDEACQLIDSIDGAMKRLRDAKAELETFLIRWLPAQPVPRLTIADTEYFIAPKKKVKDRNVGATVRAILEMSGGDEAAFLDCLSTDAVKPGAAKKVLGKRFDEFFETTIGSKLESRLQSINLKYLR